MWEGNNIKEQMNFAQKDMRYLIMETLHRKQIIESILNNYANNTPDTQTMDILVFLEITNMLNKTN